MKRCFLLLALLFLFTMGGCWNRRELDELAMVSMASFDMDEEVEVTIEFYRPLWKGGEGGSNIGGIAVPSRQIVLGSSRGDTLISAMEEMALKIPRRIYWAHARAVVVGEEFAKIGLRELIDFLDRDPESRRSTYMVLAPGRASELLTIGQGGFENTLGEEILGLAKVMRIARQDGHGYIPSVHQVILDITGDEGATFLPFIVLRSQEYPTPLGVANIEEGGEHTELPTLRLLGSGLFYRDKLVAYLNPRQTRGVMWTRGRVSKANLIVPCPICERKVSIRTLRARSNLQMNIIDGVAVGNIVVVSEGNIAGQSCICDLSGEETIGILEQRASTVIRNEIQDALDICKEVGTDVFGFASTLHRRDATLWRRYKDRWYEEFSNLEVELEVELTIRRAGLTKRPIILNN